MATIHKSTAKRNVTTTFPMYRMYAMLLIPLTFQNQLIWQCACRCCGCCVTVAIRMLLHVCVCETLFSGYFKLKRGAHAPCVCHTHTHLPGMFTQLFDLGIER